MRQVSSSSNGPRRHPREHGQVMVLFALSLLALVVAVGLAIDGGFGLYEYRQAQNAADFAAQAAATQLLANCGGPGTVLTNAAVANVINDLVAKNSPSTQIPGGWSAFYLNGYQGPSGQPTIDPTTGLPYDTLTSPAGPPGSGPPIYVNTPGTSTPASGNAPAGACGVYVKVTPQWPAFIAQIIGITHLKTAAGAAAVNALTKGVGALTSIVALGEHGAHTIFMGGSGVFNVNGTIFDNSDGWLNCSGSSDGNCTSGGTWSGPNGAVDVVDGKQSGTMNVEGNIDSYAVNPFDHCFAAPVPNAGPPGTYTLPPTPPELPYNTATCSANATTIKYYNWTGSEHAQFKSDPLGGNPAPPTPNDAYCGTSLPITNPPTTSSGGATIYYPGIYTQPVIVTGNAVFYNCSQTLDPAAAASETSNASAGLFFFDNGLALRPAAGDTVTGSDILLVTENPIANTPKTVFQQNQGDGEPAIGNGSGTCDLTLAYAKCTNSFGSTGSDCGNESAPSPGGQISGGTNCNPDGSFANPTGSQGLNDSLEIGGQGTVTLSASTGTTFPWTDFLTWQLQTTPSGTVTPSGDSIPPGNTLTANVGLDSELGDSANITLNGIVYDNSDQMGQNLSHEQYWGGNAGIPFLPGGMLLAGYGIAGGDHGTGFTCGNIDKGYTGGCNITINGLAVVDEFQTEGYTTLNITGSTYHIPGIKGTGAILTQ